MQSTLDAIRLGEGLPQRIATRIHLLLSAVPDPSSAAHFLERLRQESPAGLERVCSSPAALRYAINLFSYSTFLSEAVLGNPERLLQVANSGSFYRALRVEASRIRRSEEHTSELQ